MITMLVNVAATRLRRRRSADRLRGAAADRPSKLLGQATVPLMLPSFGIRMRRVCRRRPMVSLVRQCSAAHGTRARGGLLWAQLFELSSVEHGVVLVTSVLPSAVMNFVLAKNHNQQGKEVASAIFLGTLLSLLSIPAVLSYLV